MIAKKSCGSAIKNLLLNYVIGVLWLLKWLGRGIYFAVFILPKRIFAQKKIKKNIQ